MSNVVPFTQNAEITVYRQSVTNSTGTLETSSFDMTGWESITMISGRATTDADTSSKLFFKTSTASATGGMSETTGFQSISKTGLYLECVRPVKPFIQGAFKTTVSGADVQQIVVIRTGAKNLPATQPASTTGKVIYSPGSGTSTG